MRSSSSSAAPPSPSSSARRATSLPRCAPAPLPSSASPCRWRRCRTPRASPSPRRASPTPGARLQGRLEGATLVARGVTVAGRAGGAARPRVHSPAAAGQAASEARAAPRTVPSKYDGPWHVARAATEKADSASQPACGASGGGASAGSCCRFLGLMWAIQPKCHALRQPGALAQAGAGASHWHAALSPVHGRPLTGAIAAQR